MIYRHVNIRFGHVSFALVFSIFFRWWKISYIRLSAFSVRSFFVSYNSAPIKPVWCLFMFIVLRQLIKNTQSYLHLFGLLAKVANFVRRIKKIVNYSRNGGNLCNAIFDSLFCMISNRIWFSNRIEYLKTTWSFLNLSSVYIE